MAIPVDAVSIAEPMDPTDLIKYEADMGGYLDEGQSIASYTLALLPDAALVGVSIVETGGRVPVLVEEDRVIQFWLEVDPADREDVAFSGSGMKIGIVVTIETSAVPSERRQRTFVVTGRQR